VTDTPPAKLTYEQAVEELKTITDELNDRPFPAGHRHHGGPRLPDPPGPGQGRRAGAPARGPQPPAGRGSAGAGRPAGGRLRRPALLARPPLPFTYLAHQVPALALKRRWPAAFDGTALALGTMAPDWPYALSGSRGAVPFVGVTALGLLAGGAWALGDPGLPAAIMRLSIGLALGAVAASVVCLKTQRR
jgi:hypothetical protein